MFARALSVLAMLALLAAAAPVEAQPARSDSVTGRVVDAETGAPLADAHVFFSTTLQATATDADGGFSFRTVPVGAQRLRASMMGYAPATLDTLIRKDRRYRLTVRLEPMVLEAGSVTVTAERDKRWLRRLRKFEDLFLGETPGIKHTKILNAEVLTFEDNWWGKLTAEAHAPLIIENRALGYRITYHLDELEGTRRSVRWDGEPFFEELAPRDSAEAARWTENRRRAFYGSLRHFLLALLGDSLRSAGFRVRRIPSSHGVHSGFASRNVTFPADASSLLSPPEDEADTLPPGTRILDFHGRLRITYLNESEAPGFLRWKRERRRALRDVQRSYLELNDSSVTITPTGEIVQPYGATQFGYFAFERVANLLPKEYRPGG